MSEATSGNAAAAIPGIASLTRATTSLLRASGVTAAHAASWQSVSPCRYPGRHAILSLPGI